MAEPGYDEVAYHTHGRVAGIGWVIFLVCFTLVAIDTRRDIFPDEAANLLFGTLLGAFVVAMNSTARVWAINMGRRAGLE
ncbi:MAG: hypothetical protein AAB955_02470 [Patescibacteria group bacterium]